MGKVIMSGIVPQLSVPVTGTPLGDLAVGSIVKLNENGSPVDYIVVNQGIPSGSSLYDESCNGTWLLRKDCHSSRVWDGTNNDYANSDVHAWLNGDFLALFDSDIQSGIVQAKIPFVNGTGGSTVASGTSGLSTKVFLLGGYELGFTQSVDSRFPIDCAKLNYFIEGNDTSAQNLRIAYLNGSAVIWFGRSAVTNGTDRICSVYGDSDPNQQSGGWSFPACTASWGIRPALILPSDAKLLDDGTIKV